MPKETAESLVKGAEQQVSGPEPLTAAPPPKSLKDTASSADIEAYINEHIEALEQRVRDEASARLPGLISEIIKALLDNPQFIAMIEQLLNDLLKRQGAHALTLGDEQKAWVRTEIARFVHGEQAAAAP